MPWPLDCARDTTSWSDECSGPSTALGTPHPGRMNALAPRLRSGHHILAGCGGAPDQFCLVRVSPAFQLVLALSSRGKGGMLLGPDEFHRPACCCPIRAFALVVLVHATLRIVADTHVERAVRALEDVAKEHDRRRGAPRLRPPGSAWDTASWSDAVEAGGVEPPSEKPCHQKTTCLARSLRRSPLRVCSAFAEPRSEGARNASG